MVTTTLLLVAIILFVVVIKGQTREMKVEAQVDAEPEPLNKLEIAQMYFDMRVDEFIRGKYRNVVSWNYRDKGLNQMAERRIYVVLHLASGNTKVVEVQNLEVNLGYTPLEWESPSKTPEPDNEKNNVLEWIKKHAGIIDSKVTKAISEGKTRISYALDEDLTEDEKKGIVTVLNSTTGYEVLCDGKKLDIDFTEYVEMLD